MPQTGLLNGKIQQWRERADGYRTVAERCASSGGRQGYAGLAAACERVADALADQLMPTKGDRS